MGTAALPIRLQTTNIFDGFAAQISKATQVTSVQHGMSDKAKALLKFSIFIKKTLASFAKNNPECVREAESGTEYDEGAVRLLAESLLDEEIAGEL